MNKKRWLALGIAVLVIITQFLIPKVSVENLELQKNLEAFMPFGTMGMTEGYKEVVVSQGSSADKIAILTLDGAISSASSGIGVGYDHLAFMNQLENIRQDQAIKAVLFVVNTPGGGVFESAEIKDKMIQIQEEREIPFYVSMQQMAASGGYYVSAYADKIYATEETLTGSIGVIMTSIEVSGFLEKYGIKVSAITSGESKDIGSMFRPMKDEERKIFQDLIDETYGRFVRVVSEGRSLPEPEVRKLADGRIYSAYQAMDIGLVDAIGYKENVLADLQADYNLENARVIEYKNVPMNFFGTFLGQVKNRVLGMDPETMMVKELVESYGSKHELLYIYGGE